MISPHKAVTKQNQVDCRCKHLPLIRYMDHFRLSDSGPKLNQNHRYPMSIVSFPEKCGGPQRVTSPHWCLPLRNRPQNYILIGWPYRMSEQEYFCIVRYQLQLNNRIYNRFLSRSEMLKLLFCHDQKLHLHQVEKQSNSRH
ncbi:hypothetical protein D3C80_801720 [compost metagenome]